MEDLEKLGTALSEYEKQIMAKFAEHENQIGTQVANITGLYAKTKRGFEAVTKRLDLMEEKGKSGKSKFMDKKNMQPRVLKDIKEFTKWRRDVEDYTESVTAGMKKTLEKVKEAEDAEEDTIELIGSVSFK